MDFTAILDGIEAEGQLQVQKIEKDAAKALNEINHAAENMAGERRDRILFDGRARLNRERALIEQQASVQTLKVHADARQKLIESALEKAQRSFDSIRRRKDYKQFLSNTVDEVIASLTPSLLENQGIVIHFDTRDKETAEKILAKTKSVVEIRFDITTSGGCTGESEDGQVITLNTIESRFNHASQMIHQELSVYFEEKISLE
jgi:vacuolar-type H+-ATPase subunit E/Vma4